MELPYFLRRESFRLAKSFATADTLQSLGHLTKILGGPHDPPHSTSLCSHLVYAFMLARLSLSYWTPSANPVKQDVFLWKDFSLWSCELYCICCFFTLRLTSTAQRANFIVLFAVLSLNAVAVIIRIAELCAKSGRNTRKDFYKLGVCMRTGFA